jgi:hypothetical protein
MDKENIVKKEIGLWIDHRKAVIVIIKDEEEEIKKITSNMEKHVRFTSKDGRGEDVRDRQFGNHLNSYYDEVIAYIRDAEHEGLKARILAIETVDKMTDREISAKVREHFLT